MPVPWDLLHRDQDQLRDESRTVYSSMVKPTFGRGGHHFYMTLYGYVMSAFAAVDLHSLLWLDDPRRGTRGKINQTKRMIAYLNCYFPGSDVAHRVAVKLWRHALMHTGRPRQLVELTSRRPFFYLLHWSVEQLPVEQHFEIVNGDTLSLSLDALLQNVSDALAAFHQEVMSDEGASHRADEAWDDVALQDVELSDKVIG